jgi:hypothetical protein
MAAWYTDEEMRIIRENIGKISTEELGRFIGRLPKTVHEKARRMGLI